MGRRPERGQPRRRTAEIAAPAETSPTSPGCVACSEAARLPGRLPAGGVGRVDRDAGPGQRRGTGNVPLAPETGEARTARESAPPSSTSTSTCEASSAVRSTHRRPPRVGQYRRRSPFGPGSASSTIVNHRSPGKRILAPRTIIGKPSVAACTCASHRATSRSGRRRAGSEASRSAPLTPVPPAAGPTNRKSRHRPDRQGPPRILAHLPCRRGVWLHRPSPARRGHARRLSATPFTAELRPPK